MDEKLYLSDIIGQVNVKERIEVSLDVCKEQKTNFPHSIFSGSPGFGKTSLAQALANELDTDIFIANAGNLKQIKELLPYLVRLKENNILFIDEVHRLPIKISETLYSILENYEYYLGDAKSNFTISVPRFTFVGATTILGQIPKPLRDRCPFQYELVEYTTDELAEIISNDATRKNFIIDNECARLIAKCSRGTPRIALNRFLWIYQFCISKKLTISPKVIKSALKIIKVCEDGTEDIDHRYLSVVKRLQPASLSVLSSSLNLDVKTIKEVIEPFLLKRGMIKVSTKGRCLV